MRLLLLVDESARLKQNRIDGALNRIKEDYKVATEVSWDVEYVDMEHLQWQEYTPGALGLSTEYINKEAKRVWDRENYKYDHIIFCINPSNWRNGEQSIGGWNMGMPYYHMYIQQVKVSNNDTWLYKIFAMEIAHVIDDLSRVELGINLDRITGLDFDNDIIHGEDKRYGVPKESSKTGYFTNYDYTKVIKEFAPYITQAYQARLFKYHTILKQRITLLTKIVELLTLVRQLNLKLQATPTAIHMDEIEGHNHKHKHV